MITNKRNVRMRNVVKQINDLMKIKNVSIEQLSDGIGRQYSFVGNVLKGAARPSKTFLKEALFFLYQTKHNV